MNKQNIAFCENCLDDTEYIIKNIPVTEKVRGHEIKYVKKEKQPEPCILVTFLLFAVMYINP